MTALRWLLVLPAAVLGSLIAQLLTILVTAFIPDEVSQIVGSATVPMGFVLLGARAAPAYKVQVAGVLVLLSVLVAGMTLGWLVLGIGDYSPIVAALSVPLWLAGSVLALYIVYRQERRLSYLARKYHPDAYSGPDATQRMRQLNEAYEVLSDPTGRAEYDRSRGYEKQEARRAERETPPGPPPREQEPVPPQSAKTPAAGQRNRLVRHRPGPAQVGGAIMRAAIIALAIISSALVFGAWYLIIFVWSYNPSPLALLAVPTTGMWTFLEAISQNRP